MNSHSPFSHIFISSSRGHPRCSRTGTETQRAHSRKRRATARLTHAHSLPAFLHPCSFCCSLLPCLLVFFFSFFFSFFFFSVSYKHFFVRYNDPSSVKLQKLSILTALATGSSLVDILLELSEYVNDMDMDISRLAVRSIGAIAIRLPEAAEEAIEHLLAFLEIRVQHVTAETVIVLKDFLRKVKRKADAAATC